MKLTKMLKSVLFFTVLMIYSLSGQSSDNRMTDSEVPQSALNSDLNSPVSIVKDFYQHYLNDDHGNSAEIIARYVSDELAKNINYSLKCNYDEDDSSATPALTKICAQKRECKENKGSYICDWSGFWIESDVDYFTKSQDVYPSWKKKIKFVMLSQTNIQAVVGVSLGDGSDPVMKLQVTLDQNNNKWKIISVTE